MNNETLPQIRRRAGATTDIDAQFWDGLANNELRIQACAACKHWHWPPRWRCDACGSWEMAWPAVPMTGTVYAFARTWHPFSPAMKDHVPFVNVLIELPQAGNARLLGILIGDETGLEVGAPAVGYVQPPVAQGELYALRWRLARNASKGA